MGNVSVHTAAPGMRGSRRSMQPCSIPKLVFILNGNLSLEVLFIGIMRIDQCVTQSWRKPAASSPTTQHILPIENVTALLGRFIGAPCQEQHKTTTYFHIVFCEITHRQDDGRSVRGAHALYSAVAASKCFHHVVAKSRPLRPQIPRLRRGPSLVHSRTA